MSDSVQPQRRQPTRLPHLCDSPGKSTGVGCHFLLQCMKVKSESDVTQSCPTPSGPMDCSPPRSSIHGILQAGVLEWGAIAFSWLVAEHLNCFPWRTPSNKTAMNFHIEVLCESKFAFPCDEGPEGSCWLTAIRLHTSLLFKKLPYCFSECLSHSTFLPAFGTVTIFLF